KPSGLAYDGANIWVTSIGEGTVTKLRASDGVILGVYSVGRLPYWALFDGTDIWVSVFGGGFLVKLDPTDGTVLSQVPVSFAPTVMVFDGVRIWASLDVAPGMLAVVRADNGKVESTLQIDSSSNITGLAFDGRNIWASDFGGNVVDVIAAKSRVIRGSV